MYRKPPQRRSTADVALSSTLDLTPVAAPAAAGPDTNGDWALVQRCVQGDTEAFRPLVERHQRLAFSVAHRLLGGRADAEDVVQHAFVEAFRALPRFDGRAHENAFRVWLLRIVVNRAKDLLKSKRRSETPLDEEADATSTAFGSPPESPEQNLQSAQLRHALEAALASLPEKYRVCLVLKDIEDLSYEDMRSVLHLPITTLKIRVVRARGFLRAALEKRGSP